MDLTSLYRMVSAEAPNIPGEMMKGAAGQAALQQADEQLMANKRLRELYSSGRNVSPQDVMGISPELGIQMQQAQFKNMLEAGQIEKLNREKDEADAKVYAQHISPVAQDYFDDLKKGMPEQLAEHKFRDAVGKAQAAIEERFGIKPKVDFTQFSPLQIAQRSHILGFDIPHLKEIEEQQKAQFDIGREAGKRGLPEVVLDQFGRPVIKPGMPTGGGRANIPAPSFTFEGKTYTGPEFGQALMAEKDPERKQRMNEYVDASMKTTQSGIPGAELPIAGTTDIAGEKAKEAAAIETAKETAKAEVARGEEGKRITDAFKRAMGTGGVSRVMKLISESTSGPTETLGASVAARIPQQGGSRATSGMENIGSLNTVAGELRKTIERSAGPQSDKDVALAALDAADISNPNIPYNQRMKGFLEFTRIIKERADTLGIDPKAIGIDVDTETGDGPVKVTTKAEAEKLAPGTLFETPDGKIMRRH
jgi:hypothetical protein